MGVSNWRVLPRPAAASTSGKDQKREASSIAATATDEATVHLLQQRGSWSESSYQSALELYDQLMNCTDSYLLGPLHEALHVLEQAYRLYGPEYVTCSFNGGKDAVVILHLVRAAHAHYYQQQRDMAATTNTAFCRPRTVYFDHPDEFPEVRDFVHDTVKMYDLEMIAFEQGTKFVEGLRVLVQHTTASTSPASQQEQQATRPQPLAFVLGTRTTDPNAGQQGSFAPSSTWMPPFMRVNPILDWTYGHVWHFLRLFHLPYCSLYDQGYTSLGTVKDTFPCPALAVVNDASAGGGTTTSKYWPAYMLRDWDQERAGRISKKDKTAPITVSNTTATAVFTPKVISVDGMSSNNSNSSSLGDLSAVSTRPGAEAVGVGEDESAVSYGSDAFRQRNVGVLIIGDEILKGLTADTNTQAAGRALRDNNVKLHKVVVVSDDQAEIVKEIGRLQKEVDVIITSGGVGPTHDDVTIKSVAAALHCEMELHDEMARLLLEKMNATLVEEDHPNVASLLTDAQTKMATLPKRSKLRYLSDNPKDWPVLQCRNIFILPGIPEFFAKKIDNVAVYLSCQLERAVAYKVILSIDENSIVPILNQVVANHPNVVIGSYPFVSHPGYKTVITVEGRLGMGHRTNSTIFHPSMMMAMMDYAGGTDQQQQEDDYNSTDKDDTAAATASGSGPRSGGAYGLNAAVRLALDELITTLPEGSVLRVDNEDLTLFS